MRGEIVAQALGEAADRELAGGVDARLRTGAERSHRGDVDDMAALAVRLHPRQHGDQSVDDAAKVDPHDPVVVGMAGLVSRPEHRNAGVVDEDMDGPGRFGHVRPAGAVGDVQLEEQRRRPAALRKPGFRRGAIGLVAVGQHQIHPGVAEGAGDAETDPRHTACDQRAAALPSIILPCHAGILSQRLFAFVSKTYKFKHPTQEGEARNVRRNSPPRRARTPRRRA